MEPGNLNKEGCEFGRHLTAEVKGLDNRFEKLEECLQGIKGRPPWSVVIIISILLSVLSAMIGATL